MAEILQKIRDAVTGKKTIITAVIGILTAALAWAGGELTGWQAITAVWVAVQIIFIRTGNKKDAEGWSRKLIADVVADAYEAGQADGLDESDGDYSAGFRDGYEVGDEDARYEDE